MGKRIAVCTGRAVGEIEPYEENELQNVRYFVCENGALLYDSETKEILSSTVIPDEIVEKIIDIIDGEDCMPIGYSKGRNLVDIIFMLRDTRSCSVRPANIMMACMMHIAKNIFRWRK